MVEEPADTYQIILEKVPYERQPDTALYLSGCFSLPPASTRGIAASGPIVLITDLTREQGESILAELEVSLPEGVDLTLVRSDEETKVSRLQWPRPPRVYGRDLTEFLVKTESHMINCPHCGGKVRVTQNAEGKVTASIPANSEPGRVSSRRLPPADDGDVLFSGVKPIASAAANFVSLKSLEAGDTGFWLDYSHNVFSPAPPPHDGPKQEKAGESAKKGTARSSAGLAAFMKPGVFALVVGRTKDPQVVKMIADIMGIDKDEAEIKCLKLGLCVARGISLDEAQNLLVRFKSLGAKARIVKPM